MRDVGFAAEEVECVEPLLVTYNPKGEIEGVKYGQLTTVLVNAVKEQQAQIENQQKQIGEQEHQTAFHLSLIHQYHKQLAAQQSRIAVQDLKLVELHQELAVLKQLLCHTHPKAGICRGMHRR